MDSMDQRKTTWGAGRSARVMTRSVILALALGVIASGYLSAKPVRVGNLEAELVTEMASIAPGQPFWVALRLNLDPEWHVYWRNPGDAGLPPTISWNLPSGWTAGEIQWPLPQVLSIPPLTSFAYSGEVLLPLELTPPANVSAGENITLSALADWLICRESCIPGDAQLTLDLVVGKSPQSDPHWTEQFSKARALLPVLNPGWFVSASAYENELALHLDRAVTGLPSPDSLFFLPYTKAVIDNAAAQPVLVSDSGFTLRLTRSQYSQGIPDTITGLLISRDGWNMAGQPQGIEVSTVVTQPPAPVSAASTGESFTIWRALLFAFVGGLILNLMPCVLPVLSLKILNIVGQAGEDHRKVLMHGVVFSIGVLLSFLTLAAALLVLRAGGEQLGWGFQLQSPAVIVVLSVFFFLFGLSLLGVFEIGASLTTVGGKVAGKSGFGGSFLNGVTATIVATPCSAPFMGSALGFAVTQPAIVAMSVFAALGIGMAFPFLLLSARPQLLKFLPKPGAWMETMKQVMGFLLIATVIWLAWVLSAQSGSLGVIRLMGTLLLAGIAAWVLGRWGALHRSTFTRRIAYVTATLGIVLGLTVGLTGSSMPAAAELGTQEGRLPWETFSDERVSSLRASGKSVFVDFTAAWCLSCQVNEQVALETDAVRQKFAELGIVPLKADWTNRDPKITRALAQYGRNSVPLYVLFGPSLESEPVLLPEILTPDIVLNALNTLTNTGATEVSAVTRTSF